MKQATITINAEQGLHARPAGILQKTASKFTSKITIEKNGKTVDAKRLLSILSLAGKKGDVLSITADGVDELEAIEAVVNIIETAE